MPTTFEHPIYDTTHLDARLVSFLTGVPVARLDEWHEQGIAPASLFGPPAILFFGPDGRERRELRVVGFMGAGEFRRIVERATSPSGAIGVARG